MIKSIIRVVLGRLLPGAAAIALFTSALSPLRPALDAFGAAASALAGGADIETADIGAPELPTPSALFGDKDGAHQQATKTRLRAIAGQFTEQPEVPVFGQEPPKKKPGKR